MCVGACCSCPSARLRYSSGVLLCADAWPLREHACLCAVSISEAQLTLIGDVAQRTLCTFTVVVFGFIFFYKCNLFFFKQCNSTCVSRFSDGLGLFSVGVSSCPDLPNC